MADLDLIYVTSDGDVLDQIVFAHYGNLQGEKVEAVMAANPGLAAQGPILTAGIRIKLPDLAAATPVETAQLWG